MSPFIRGLRAIAAVMFAVPLLAAASEGSELIFQFDKKPTAASEKARQVLECRAVQMFEKDISYPWPQAGGNIVMYIPRQRASVIAESEQEIRVRIPNGIVVLVGMKSVPKMPASAWSEPADGGMRVHGFIEPRMLSAAVEKHLRDSRFNIPVGESKVQSLGLTANGSKLEVRINLADKGEEPGLLVIRGTPRFVTENGSVSMVVPDAETTYNGKLFTALQNTLRAERLWRLDVDLSTVATKAGEFLQSQTRPGARAEVKAHPDLRVEVADNLLHFSLSVDATVTYADVP